MDPEYDPSHKTSSITSTTSTNSWDTVPSLTASSVCDVDSPSMNEQSILDDYSFTGDRDGLAMSFADFPTLHENVDATCHNRKLFSHSLDHSLTLSGESDSPIFLHQSHEIAIPHSTTTKQDSARKSLLIVPTETKTEHHVTDTDTITNRNNNDIDDEDDDSASGQFKPSRDLLTENEKRANHIASEQKRRNTIRTGFREMTEIIPTLKNINNSKSTILFKAVEYIRHLDKCNRGLRDKLNSLQVRLEVEGRIGGLIRGPHHLLRRRHRSHYHNEHQSKRNRSSIQQQLPPETLAALLLQQNQQKQLEMLQEQLRYQQELLTRYNISTTNSDSPRGNHRRLSTDEQSTLSSPSYLSMSIPSDHPSSSETSAFTSSSLSQRQPSIYNRFSSLFERNYQQGSSASAMVTDGHLYPSYSSSTGSPLGVSSFNIPADNDCKSNLVTSSKLHP